MMHKLQVVGKRVVGGGEKTHFPEQDIEQLIELSSEAPPPPDVSRELPHLHSRP